jgi:hypothetical protein
MSAGPRKVSFVAQLMRRKIIAGLALCASMVALGLVILPVAPAHAQTPLHYMTLPAPLCLGPACTTPNPATAVSSGTSYALPGYSPTPTTPAVLVTLSGTFDPVKGPFFNRQSEPTAFGKSAGGVQLGQRFEHDRCI